MAISLKHNFQSAVADEGDTSLVRPSNWNAEHDLTLATSRLVGRTTAGTGSAEEISVGTGLNLSSGSLSVGSTTPQVNSINTFTAAQVIDVNNNSNPALRITQTGTADALRIEDEASPDATPFVITANGHAVAGYGSALAIETVVPQFQSHTATLDEGGFGGVDWGNTATGQVNWFGKSRGGSYGTQAILQNNDTIGDFRFYGSDGVNLIPAARIEVDVDGTPGVNDMPGRIAFFTTADGEGTVTERMRINSAGNVGIGAAVSSNAVQSLLHLMSTAGGGDVPRLRFSNGSTGHSATDGSFIGISNNSQLDFWNFENNAMRFATNNSERMRIDASGNVGISTINPQSRLHVNANGSTFSLEGTDHTYMQFYPRGVASGRKAFIGFGSPSGTNLSVFNEDNGALLLGTNNTERMRIDASGNAGIGTASPICRLEVATSANVNALTVGNRGANTSNALVLLSTSSVGSGMAMSAGDGIDLRIPSGVNNAVRTALSAENYAGTSPNWADVQVLLGSSNSVSARRAAIVYNGVDNALSFRTGATGSHSSQTLSGTERMRIDSAGNVGIGVTPSAWGSNWRAIETAGNSSSVLAAANVNGVGLSSNVFNDNSGWIYKTTGAAARYSVNTNTHQWFVAPSGTAGTSVTFTQAMTLDASGRLSIGTTNTGGSKLTVQDSSILVRTDGDILKVNDVADSTYWFRLSRSSSDFEIANRQAGSIKLMTSDIERFRIGISGQFGIGGANYGTAGQVLTSNGSGAAPSWTTVSGGGVTADDVVTLALILG